MRSPPWVVPETRPPFGAEEWEKYSPRLLPTLPFLGRAMRTIAFLSPELEFFQIFSDNARTVRARKRVESQLIGRMKRIVPEKYHEILTPNYGVGCKRKIFDETWYPSLQDPAIELTTLPLSSIQTRDVTLGPRRMCPNPQDKHSKVPTDERKLPADMIILANGYDTTIWLYPLKIKGKDGQLMEDV